MKRLTYREMMIFETFEERFEYLKLGGQVGRETFGGHRYLNQRFYTSPEWKKFRRDILIRDMGCDLAMEDRPIYGKVFIHHMNPIEISDISEIAKLLLPNEVVCVSFETHQAIHYGDISLLMESSPVTRQPNDTIPWR